MEQAMNEKHLLHHFSFKGTCGKSKSRVTFDYINHKKKRLMLLNSL